MVRGKGEGEGLVFICETEDSDFRRRERGRLGVFVRLKHYSGPEIRLGKRHLSVGIVLSGLLYLAESNWGSRIPVAVKRELDEVAIRDVHIYGVRGP